MAIMADREQGTVKWFNSEKGYGFIRPARGGRDIFVHHSSIDKDGFRTLQEGDLVEYTIGDGPKGPNAQRVTVVS